MSIEEHERAILAEDLPEKGLKTGDVGTVVSVHEGEREAAGYTLEFFTPSGDTVAVVIVPADAVLPVGDRQVLHARDL